MFFGIALLVVVFTGYSFAVKLSQKSDVVLALPTLLKLIGLNSLIAMEVLLPTALYLSVISTLSRFYRDSEMTAMNAAGYSELHLVRTVGLFTLVVAVLVGGVSLYARPWAYRQSYQIEADARAEFDIRKIEAGHFLELQNAAYVLFAGNIDRRSGKLSEVFLQSERGTGKRARVQVIYAREAYMAPVGADKRRTFEFHDGYSYLLDPESNRDTTLKFGQLTIPIPGVEADTSYRRKAESSATLSQSDSTKDIAEYQWRLSTPVATLVLALVAVPLSRSAPRQGRHTSFIVAISVYTALFILTSAARNWVADGKIPTTPGIWWVYTVPLLLFAVLIWLPRLKWKAR
jgi:lipopolysaccharide export system permease protein